MSEQQPVRVSITQTQSIVTRKRDITYLKYRHQKKCNDLFAFVFTIPCDAKKKLLFGNTIVITATTPKLTKAVLA